MMNDNSPIRQAVRTAEFDEVLAEHLGLNPTDLRCLELVVADDGATPGRIAERSGLTTGAITGVLDRLEKAGYTVRQPDPADRRSVVVRPVPARIADLADAMASLDTAIDALLAAYTQEQRASLESFLVAAAQISAEETARLRAETRGGFVGDTFHAPLGGVTRGRLAFSSGAPRMAVNVAPLGPRAAARIIMETSASRLDFASTAPVGQLIVASFDGPRPDVRATGGTVTVRYRRQPVAAFAARRARIALSGEIPWSIELDGGLTDLTGSLDGVRLQRLDVEGGTNHLSLVLPRPSGTATVRLSGVASAVAFSRPAGVPVAIRLGGGISHLRVDSKRREQVRGQRRYVGEGFEESPDRYELEVLGGASDLTVS